MIFLVSSDNFVKLSWLTLFMIFSLSTSDLTEIAECSREYSEQCHRTYPDVTDVKMALADLGKDFHIFRAFCQGHCLILHNLPNLLEDYY